MNNCENCIDNRPRIGRLAGVTRTLRLAIYEGEGVPTGTPQDLTGNDVVVRVLRDGTEDIYLPGFVVEGDDHNVIKFEWPAAEQAVGNYTIDVTVTDGSGNVNRVNWHGPTGIRLVEFSYQEYGEDAVGQASSEGIGLVGYYTTNGVGMSAYDEWLAQGHTGTEADYIAWMQQPAREAASVAEAAMTVIQARADEDHATAGSDHTTATGDHAVHIEDHRIAGLNHLKAEDDHTRANTDHSRAESDHSRAEDDHSTAGADHTQAGSDHTRANTDHSRAESDHVSVVADHLQAAADHTKATQDSTRAGSDHDIAVADHAQAEADHTRAESDHTTAAADHTTAASDHTTAAADHTQAVADHAVMAGYDTRLTNVETDVTQLGLEITDKTSFTENQPIFNEQIGYRLRSNGNVEAAGANTASVARFDGNFSGKAIVVSGRVGSATNLAMVAFYQSDGTFISAALTGNGTAKNYVDEPLTAPSLTGRIKISGNSNYQSPVLKVLTTVKDIVGDLITVVPVEKKVYPTLEYGAFTSSSGVFSEMQSEAGGSGFGYKKGIVRTPKFIVCPNNSVPFKMKVSLNLQYRAFFYNLDYTIGAVNDWVDISANTAQDVYSGYPFVRFQFRISSSTPDVPMFVLELSGDFQSDYEQYNVRSIDAGFQTIAIGVSPIDGGVSNDDTNQVQDIQTYKVDYGVLALPETYSNNGKPTRLIIYCHGAAVGYTSASKRFDSGDIDPTYWLSEGYAILDVDGEFYADNHQHTYLPEARQAYLAAYHWVTKNYNIRKDGVFLGGRSMGGGMCFDLLESNMPIIAACPVVPVCNMLWWWNYMPKQYREDCADKMGFEGTAPTWTGQNPMTQDEWDYLYANFDKMVKYAPVWRCILDLPGKEILFNGTRIATTTISGSAVEAEAAIFANLHAQVKAPVKFFDNYTDPIVPYSRNALLMYRMLVNAGQITELRMFDAEADEDTSISAHHFELRADRLVEWTNSFGVTLQNVPVVYIEMLAFWRRYEQVNGSY